MKQVTPDMKLDGFTFKEALESIYCVLAGVLLARGETESLDLFRKTIPAYVFEVAVGAGWIPLAQELDAASLMNGEVIWQADLPLRKNALPEWVLKNIKKEKEKEKKKKEKGYKPPEKIKLTKNQSQRLEQFGEFVVDRAFLQSFVSLLKDVITFHSAERTLHEERLNQLPTATTTEERESLLSRFRSNHPTEGKIPTLTQVAKWAGVDYSILFKWKNGKLADSAEASKRISLLLRFEERNRPRSYRVRLASV